MAERATADMLETLLEAIPLGIKIWKLEHEDDPGSLRLLFSNRSASEATGVPRDLVIGKTIAEGFPDAVPQGIAEAFASVVRTGQAADLGEITYSDPRVREGVFSIVAFPLPDRCVGVAFNNITKEKLRLAAVERKAAFVNLLKEVAVAANESESVPAAFRRAIDAICAHTRWPVGHVYRRTPGAEEGLQPTTIWHLDDPERYAAFRSTTLDTPLAIGAGLPGRVLESGRPDWLTDLKQDDRFPPGIGNLGLRAGFAFPVLVGSEVAAVLEFYSPESKLPDELLLDVMEQIGIQLGRVVERDSAQSLTSSP